MKIHRALLILLASQSASAVFAANASYDFSLAKPALTSAGVYDADGKLVRVLWTMEKSDAGKFTKTWDGKDDLGHDLPAGSYSFKVIANRATYANVGSIGNSGLPADAKHHTPAHIAAIAVDDEGSVYSANGWDEAGADFKKWDKDGKSLFDADFSIRNGHPNGAPYAIAVDDKYIYCSVGGWANAEWKEAQQIQRFSRTDGKAVPFTKTGREDGHIQVYEWPSKMIPAGTSQEDAELMKLPLRSIAVLGKSLYVADAFGWLREYNKETGEIILPGFNNQPGLGTVGLRSISATARGGLWYGNVHDVEPREDLNSIGDNARQTAFIDASQVVGIALDQDQHLYIADADAGDIKMYLADKHLDKGKLLNSFGQRAAPGDRAADHFFHITSVAVDKSGNIFTAQDEPYGGARLAKFSPDHKLLWEHFGCEFVSLGNYGIDNPEAFYSMTFHNYALLDHNAGKWEYSGNGSPFPERKYYSDVHGVPRVIKLGDHSFYFLPSGDGVQIYRISGNAFHLAALVGGRSPAPDGTKESKQLGQWTWHDANNKGEPTPDQINWFKKAGEGHYSCFGMDVDLAGNIIFANTDTHSIWTIPMGPFDDKKNPTYDWKDAKEVFPRDTSPMKFEPNMVQRADDGSYYAFGWSAAWPQPKDNPFWMGGTTLARFDKAGKLLWAVPTPKLVVGIDAIPGGKGGCFVGEGKDAKLDHYSADGLLIGSMRPGEAMCKQTGWLDNHASVAVNRDLRDGVIDVFTEDDYVLRIGWYRVNDADMETLTGQIAISK